MSLPRLLVISAVRPFPGVSGQQRRVQNMLRAARSNFHVTFLTLGDPDSDPHAAGSDLWDELLVLESRYRRSRLPAKALYKLAGFVYSIVTGLKFSNYRIGVVEFTPERVGMAVGDRRFDYVLFEYWHAAECVAMFKEHGTKCALDMHDILWRSYEAQLNRRAWMPRRLRRSRTDRYRRREETAWAVFDLLIAINYEEELYVRERSISGQSVICIPMGIDLKEWPFSADGSPPARVAFYGGLGSSHNEEAARLCYEEIMPILWRRGVNAEYWIIGSNPPRKLSLLAREDKRVHVTGFRNDVAPLLGSTSVLLCPWNGTYGFRSRLIEAMACGVPVVTSPDAIYGMELIEGRGLQTADTPTEMAEAAIRILTDQEFARSQRLEARTQVEERYSFEATYGRLPDALERVSSSEALSTNNGDGE